MTLKIRQTSATSTESVNSVVQTSATPGLPVVLGGFLQLYEALGLDSKVPSEDCISARRALLFQRGVSTQRPSRPRLPD
jgi:hypothetical protein